MIVFAWSVWSFDIGGEGKLPFAPLKFSKRGAFGEGKDDRAVVFPADECCAFV
jgi:hypothetical protein